MAFLLLTAAAARTPASAGPASVTAPRQTPPTLGAAPSDPRATFHDGNATTCGDVGYPNDIQVGEAGNAPAGDGYVEGTVTGSDPMMLQVVITPAGTAAGVVVDAVVVKGSNGYNVYEAPYVPPAEAPPQNYLSPLTHDDGPSADFSHWYVCYSLADPVPPAGALLVAKRVIPPPGPPVDDLPTQYSADVTCTDAGGTVVAQDTITFSAGGGLGTTSSGARLMTGIPVGSTCTVVEQDTDAFPAGATVSYVPAGAATSGITIGNSVGAVVAIVNDFSNVAVQTGSLRVEKVLVGTPPAGLPASFQVDVLCSDGTTAKVTVPATGGPGTPVVDDITGGAYCAAAEVGVPEGVKVTYSVDGGSPTDRIARFQVASDTTVTLTVTNDASTVPTTSTTTPSNSTTTTATPPPSTTTPPAGSDRLANTGMRPEWTTAGAALLALGGLLVLLSRRLALR